MTNSKIYCKTTRAVLLLGIPVDGILRFPSRQMKYPGILCDIDTNLPVYEQLLAAVSKELGEQILAKDFELNAGFFELIQMKESKSGEACLYAGKLLLKRSIPLLHWHKLPDILRKMSKNRSRLAYLKAWQVLSDGVQNNLRAAEMDKNELSALAKERQH